jgi:predicted tellurium resistance membrane protein TerC
VNRLPARRQKKAQLVRSGYLGIGIGVVLLLLAVATASWILGIFAIVVVGLAGWLTSIFRGA